MSFEAGWITATVEEAKQHYVECRMSKKGKPMRVAYEHVSFFPFNELAEEFAECYVEDDITESDRDLLEHLNELTVKNPKVLCIKLW